MSYISKQEFEVFAQNKDWNNVVNLMFQMYNNYVWGKERPGLPPCTGKDKYDYDDIRVLAVEKALYYLQKHYKPGKSAFSYAFKGIMTWIKYYLRENRFFRERSSAKLEKYHEQSKYSDMFMVEDTILSKEFLKSFMQENHISGGTQSPKKIQKITNLIQ